MHQTSSIHPTISWITGGLAFLTILLLITYLLVKRRAKNAQSVGIPIPPGEVRRIAHAVNISTVSKRDGTGERRTKYIMPFYSRERQTAF